MVHAASVPVGGQLADDLPKLQELLEDAEPAYILAKLDEPSSDWLAIHYVPDNAKVRDKVRITFLMASTASSPIPSSAGVLNAYTVFHPPIYT